MIDFTILSLFSSVFTLERLFSLNPLLSGSITGIIPLAIDSLLFLSILALSDSLGRKIALKKTQV